MCCTTPLHSRARKRKKCCNRIIDLIWFLAFFRSSYQGRKVKVYWRQKDEEREQPIAPLCPPCFFFFFFFALLLSIVSPILSLFPVCSESPRHKYKKKIATSVNSWEWVYRLLNIAFFSFCSNSPDIMIPRCLFKLKHGIFISLIAALV